MNEPNAWPEVLLNIVKPDGDPDEDQQQALANLYERSLAAVRVAEARVSAPKRLFLFEPSPDWAQEHRVYAPYLRLISEGAGRGSNVWRRAHPYR